MSYQLTRNYTDSSDVTYNIQRPNLSYATDFRVKSEVPDKTILTNITSPKDRPELLTTQCQDIANIYANTGIEPCAQAPSSKGTKLYVSLTDIYRYIDDADPSLPFYDLPVSAQLVIKIPNFEAVNEEVALETICRLYATLFETGSESTNRLKALFRGAMTPSNL